MLVLTEPSGDFVWLQETAISGPLVTGCGQNAAKRFDATLLYCISFHVMAAKESASLG